MTDAERYYREIISIVSSIIVALNLAFLAYSAISWRSAPFGLLSYSLLITVVAIVSALRNRSSFDKLRFSVSQLEHPFRWAVGTFIAALGALLFSFSASSHPASFAYRMAFITVQALSAVGDIVAKMCAQRILLDLFAADRRIVLLVYIPMADSVEYRVTAAAVVVELPSPLTGGLARLAWDVYVQWLRLLDGHIVGVPSGNTVTQSRLEDLVEALEERGFQPQVFRGGNEAEALAKVPRRYA